MITPQNRFPCIKPNFIVKEMLQESPVVHTAWLEICFPKKEQKTQPKVSRWSPRTTGEMAVAIIQFLTLRLGSYQSSNFLSLNRAIPNVTTSFPGTKSEIWRQNLSCQNKNPLNYFQFSLDLPDLHVLSQLVIVTMAD